MVFSVIVVNMVVCLIVFLVVGFLVKVMGESIVGVIIWIFGVILVVLLV